jgi:hypothetical protein
VKDSGITIYSGNSNAFIRVKLFTYHVKSDCATFKKVISFNNLKNRLVHTLFASPNCYVNWTVSHLKTGRSKRLNYLTKQKDSRFLERSGTGTEKPKLVMQISCFTLLQKTNKHVAL